mmetsp:Transcript_9197/g.29183  ORF Transcript_9197/g.29183 Transcript_9197/m.29183 type:complete len:407 (-) Transcript_9197:546-1766(-)
MFFILLALALCCGARAMAATQWYMPDGRAGGCRSDKSVNGGSGAYEEMWLADAADCRARCAAEAICIAYEFGSLASRRVKGKEYKRCELHHSVVFNVAAIPGFECWVKVPRVPPPPSPPPGVKWCVSYAFGEYVVGVTVAALLCSLAALLALACLRRTRPHLSSPLLPAKRRRYSGLITWLLLITAPVMGWLFAVAPYAICYSSPVAAVVGLTLWILVSFAMGVAALSDPGVIPDLKWPDDPPPRAKHDRQTGRCVHKFDHFCVFIGNSVGRGNYRWFLSFVGLTSLSALYLLAWCVFHVVDLAGRLELEGGVDRGTAFAKAVGQAIGSVVLGFYFAVMGTLVSLLLVLHCYLVSTAQTTAEFMRGRWKKETNPYDRGARSNWLDVLCDRDSDGASSQRGLQMMWC